MSDLYNFVKESNRIEGIYLEPAKEEVAVSEWFLALAEINEGDLQDFVDVCQPGAMLRDRPGLDVRVGNHVAPPGGEGVRQVLEHILWKASDASWTAYEVHREYETLHPFTDCNGRSGRILWAWQMKEFPLGFLHRWYYQSLQASR